MPASCPLYPRKRTLLAVLTYPLRAKSDPYTSVCCSLILRKRTLPCLKRELWANNRDLCLIHAVHTVTRRVQGAPAGAEPMWILMFYILIVVIGESVVVAIGLVLDRIYPVLSLPVCLSLCAEDYAGRFEDCSHTLWKLPIGSP